MKKTFFLLLFSLAVALSANAQSAEKILKKSSAKCHAIQNGYYHLKQYMKYMSSPDTGLVEFDCYFKKIQNDSLYPVQFKYHAAQKGQAEHLVMYTGAEMVTGSIKDSAATVMSTTLWASDIKQFRHNYTFYEPFTHPQSRPMPGDSAFLDQKHTFKLIGAETVQNQKCYHIQMMRQPENEPGEMIQVTKIETHFWIGKKSHLPIQYSIEYELVMNNDTMIQYERNLLTDYRVNSPFDERLLSLQGLPAYYKLKEYAPYMSPDPLATGTEAPDWKFPSLAGDSVSLKNLRGSLVLVDFFYKACYPCMQALPSLQALHEKYKDKGLVLIGMDPFDKKEDNMADFLAKRGVSYQVLLANQDIARQYHVSGYPTMYLIGKDGKILHVQVGFGEGVEAKLEALILKNL